MPQLVRALEAMRKVLGFDFVRSARDVDLVGLATTGSSRAVDAVVYPETHDQVRELVRIANRFGIALYPVSTGNNWGYGSSLPPRDGAVVVHLSRMNRILDVDAELGLARIEPGVTQAQLAAYLDQHGLDFLVPVTGAGPDCSLVGNALERGYGITPSTDHFGSVVRLAGVLGSGEPYEGPWGGANGGDGFKWGIGPYVDGLFAQGNVGVVTSATVALARRPEHAQAFLFEIARDEDLEAAVTQVREVLRRVGALIGGINLMNRERILAMMPSATDGARSYGVAAWTGAGSLYGPRSITRAARAEIRRQLAPVARRLVFLDARALARARRLLSLIPSRAFGALRAKVDRAAELLRLVEGRPSRVALPLARARTGGNGPGGLIWCAPLVPMRGGDARRLTEIVRRVLGAYGVDALITMTSLSERGFDCSIPILFDGASELAAAQARRCARALLDELWAHGYFPYRVGTDDMEWLARRWGAHADVVGALKRALDPNGVIAPGRYAAVDHAASAGAARRIQLLGAE